MPVMARRTPSFTPRQRAVLETNAARDRAEILLSGLLHAQRVVEKVKSARDCGRAGSRESMDRAISSTKRLIVSLDRALRMAEDDLRDEAMDVLDAPDG
jgi:hypothetical protein